jgi:hypothetical protein
MLNPYASYAQSAIETLTNAVRLGAHGLLENADHFPGIGVLFQNPPLFNTL